MAHPRTISFIHGELPLPAFLPDATRGFVRSMDAGDLKQAGVQGVVMNVFHLMQKPGSSTIQTLGGLHAMADWPHPVITDSGGFQVYSLIRQNPKYGSLSEKGMVFRAEASQRKFQLTPEKSVQLQVAYGSDAVMCLDDCTHVDTDAAEQEASVTRTIAWAKRCRAEFERQMDQRKWDAARRPMLFGVVQGGGDPALRQRCAGALLEIGFDGYGYGGWPLDRDGVLLKDMLAATRSFIPPVFPMHALGVGHPGAIVTCSQMGYDLFDSALPTRDARRGRLYQFTSSPSKPDFRFNDGWFDMLYIQDKKHVKRRTPVSSFCDCYTCSRYSTGYLHHLYTCRETLYYRLATIHNLRFMTSLMALIGPMNQP